MMLCTLLTLILFFSHNKGLPFIQNKNDLPRNCFISSEAVWWCMSHVDDINTEVDAIKFMQIMLDFDTIRHISPNQRIFIHGFYLYYVVCDENRNNNNHMYTKDYLEVGFCDLDFSGGKEDEQKIKKNGSSLIAVKDLLPKTFHTLPITWNETLEAYQNLLGEYSRAEFSGNSKKVKF
jgi:hypothetical protein